MKISEILSMQYCGEMVHTGVCEISVGDLCSRIGVMRSASNIYVELYNRKHGRECGMFERIENEYYTVNDVNHVIAEELGLITSNPLAYLVGVVSNSDYFVNVGSLFWSIFSAYDFRIDERFDFTIDGENLPASAFTAIMPNVIKSGDYVEAMKRSAAIDAMNEVVGFMDSHMFDPEYIWDHILTDLYPSTMLTFQFAFTITE